jgi:hypothetical protein
MVGAMGQNGQRLSIRRKAPRVTAARQHLGFEVVVDSCSKSISPGGQSWLPNAFFLSPFPFSLFICAFHFIGP